MRKRSRRKRSVDKGGGKKKEISRQKQTHKMNSSSSKDSFVFTIRMNEEKRKARLLFSSSFLHLSFLLLIHKIKQKHYVVLRSLSGCCLSSFLDTHQFIRLSIQKPLSFPPSLPPSLPPPLPPSFPPSLRIPLSCNSFLPYFSSIIHSSCLSFLLPSPSPPSPPPHPSSATIKVGGTTNGCVLSKYL